MLPLSSPFPPRAILLGLGFALLAIAVASLGTARAESLAGRDFWFAWPETPDVTVNDPGYDLDASLVLLAPHGAVTVRVQGPGVDTVIDVDPSAASFVRLPRGAAMVTLRDVPVAAGIHAWTEGCTPFAALFKVPGTGASVGDDVARLFPTPLLGRTLLPVGYKGRAEFVVVAVEDGTEVRITDPNCSSPPPQVLDRGEALLHGCQDPASDVDVTGTVVEASRPVAIISGSAESKVIHHRIGPAEVFFSHADVLLESPWPVELQGRLHARAPFRHDAPDAAGDLVRVVSGCPGNAMSAAESDADVWSETLPAVGDFAELEVWDPIGMSGRLVDEAILIETLEPALVASYTVGHDGFGGAGVGDPSLSILDPAARWERELIAWLPEGYWNSVGLVAPVGVEGSVRIDGVAPVGAWRPVADGSRFSWLRVDDLPAGVHRITAAEPLFAELSGYLPARYGACSHPAIPLSDTGLPSVRITGPADCGPVQACPGDPVTLGVAGSFAAHSWSTGESTPEIVVRPEVTTEYTVTVVDAQGCSSFGRRVVEVDGSLPPLTVDGQSEVCEGECTDLQASPGFDSYEWDTGDSGASLGVCPTVPSTYTVTATTAEGCRRTARHEVRPIAYPIPGAAAAEVELPCGLRTRLQWEPATWRPGSAGGVYNVYRRQGGCAAVDDPSWSLVATGLSDRAWVDDGVTPGLAYSYLVEAEDLPGTIDCRPGPSLGGPTRRTCASPEAVVPPGDPDLPLLERLSPHLRALGYEVDAPGGRPTSVTFGWPGAPGLAAGTKIEVHRSEEPRLLPHELVDAAASWRDEAPRAAELLFYRFYNATACGSRIE